MSAADCRLGPLATAARERGEDVRVWRVSRGYRADVGMLSGHGKTAQEACDDLEDVISSHDAKWR